MAKAATPPEVLGNFVGGGVFDTRQYGLHNLRQYEKSSKIVKSTVRYLEIPVNLYEISHARSVQFCIDECQKPPRPKVAKMFRKAIIFWWLWWVGGRGGPGDKMAWFAPGHSFP